MAIIIDEQLATLLLAYCIQDTRVSWAGWGQLVLVNKAFRDVSRAHSAQIVAYRFAHMRLLLVELQRELFWWRRSCTCNAFWRSDSSESGSEDDVIATPQTSQEY
jgi:hypothetical protein